MAQKGYEISASGHSLGHIFFLRCLALQQSCSPGQDTVDMREASTAAKPNTSEKMWPLLQLLDNSALILWAPWAFTLNSNFKFHCRGLVSVQNPVVCLK